MNIERILTWVAPHSCVNCNDEGALLCSKCQLLLPAAPNTCYRCNVALTDMTVCKDCQQYGLAEVYATTRYENTAKQLLWYLKFQRAQAAAAEMATIMASTLDLPRDAIITQAPTANARVRIRGYDQAALLAKGLAKHTGLPYAPLLARTSNNRQLGATRSIRQDQMRYAFRPQKTYLLQNNPVILVDDVLTTGSTLEAAAKVLLDAGASRIIAVVFARA